MASSRDPNTRVFKYRQASRFVGSCRLVGRTFAGGAKAILAAARSSGFAQALIEADWVQQDELFTRRAGPGAAGSPGGCDRGGRRRRRVRRGEERPLGISCRQWRNRPWWQVDLGGEAAARPDRRFQPHRWQDRRAGRGTCGFRRPRRQTFRSLRPRRRAFCGVRKASRSLFLAARGRRGSST